MTGPGSSGDGPDASLTFLALGGAGEIGMNLNLYRFAGKWLMVDLGVTFADETTPGVDLLMPDTAFIEARSEELLGLVLTHAHEDHLGAVPHLWPRLRCPVYATGFAASVLRRKLQEVDLADEVPITEVPLSGSFEIGPFAVELITLTHSIPEPNALVIRTAAGTVLHTGDWKLDPDPLVGPTADEDALKRLADEGVLAMVCDSTNVLEPGHSGSEGALRKSLVELVGQCNRRVLVACFASNVARLETIAAVAAANDRHAALCGRSLWRMYDVARENGYLRDIHFLREEEVAYLAPERALIACTGSQGERRAALARIAVDDHAHVVVEPGDTVIFSSKIIPGNEKPIFRLHNQLTALGAQVITEKDRFVHVSGHPNRDELVSMYQWVQPRIAVPVHGEARHIVEHAKLARECQVPVAIEARNGAMIRLAPDRPGIVAEVTAGRLALDGRRLVPVGGEALRARSRMAWNGMAVATVVIDARNQLAGDPQLTLEGLLDGEDDDALHRAAVDALRRAVEAMPKGARRDDSAVREVARRAVRRFLHETCRKRPPTEVHLVRL